MKSIYKKQFRFFYKQAINKLFKSIYQKPKFNKNNYKDKTVSEFKVKIDTNNYSIFILKKGRVYTDSNDTTAYISKKNIITKASMQYYKFDKINSFNNDISKNETLINGTPKYKKKFKGKILSLLSGGASKDNFTHWFTDVIPRLKIYSKKFKLSQIDKFYVPSLKYKFQIDSLKLLGIDKKKLITSERFKHLESDYIYATSHPCFHAPIKVKRWSLDYLRKSYLKKNYNKKYKKIFVDRDQLKLIDMKNLQEYKNFRILINENEIKEYLTSKGFIIIKPENFSFKEQINIFSNAKCVIGLYGAAMMMLSFCKKNTKVIEIKPQLGGNEFKNISNLLNLKHSQIILKPILKSRIPQNGLLFCPIKKIKDKINTYN